MGTVGRWDGGLSNRPSGSRLTWVKGRAGIPGNGAADILQVRDVQIMKKTPADPRFFLLTPGKYRTPAQEAVADPSDNLPSRGKIWKSTAHKDPDLPVTQRQILPVDDAGWGIQSGRHIGKTSLATRIRQPAGSARFRKLADEVWKQKTGARVTSANPRSGPGMCRDHTGRRGLNASLQDI
ncbi:hypothetical protein B0H10DRAFT_1962261 [Mycena sp. CBHHK59/15]|nr:hypothetical protein B0H10DRAFT_1962261 [Mycena sp. CBHHK59/15]